MNPTIFLVLADNMTQGEEVIKKAYLDIDDCAVITNPAYLDTITLDRNEQVYMHGQSSSNLFEALKSKMGSHHTINIQVINP